MFQDAVHQGRFLEKGYLFKSLKGEHKFARQTRELPGRGDCGKGTGQQGECAWWGMAWGLRSRGCDVGLTRAKGDQQRSVVEGFGSWSDGSHRRDVGRRMC